MSCYSFLKGNTLTNPEHRYKIWKKVWSGRLQREDLECKSEDNSLGINFFHWLLLYLWGTIGEEASGAVTNEGAYVEVGGDDE